MMLSFFFRQAGFSDTQVEALVNFQKSVNAQLATSTELQSVKTELQTEMRIMKAELKNDIDRLENRLTLRMGAMAAFIVCSSWRYEVFCLIASCQACKT